MFLIRAREEQFLTIYLLEYTMRKILGIIGKPNRGTFIVDEMSLCHFISNQVTFTCVGLGPSVRNTWTSIGKVVA